ncbi:ABC transporter ATP-binding protein [Bacillus horti]|uniref:ATP-binding cassette subfamily B protein n=1 Tax=Caldalkalibacillus horti TaxID=77523 RepID=A0ABT9VXS3_9BACI|nr:ABC transporter ATP-binding protein [Bacillus horti]MDQ0165793.1 ATP-binding cassette subfamily B protein [Bacillus horti]
MSNQAKDSVQYEVVSEESRKKTTRLLFQYALRYKKTIAIALILLTVAVVAELAGPFLAKRLIDNHIVGVDSYPWHITTEQGTDTVEYGGSLYKRSDRMSAGEASLGEARILQVGKTFYFLEGSIDFDGERRIAGNKMIIRNGEQEVSYDVTPLSLSELTSFYQPEIKYIVQLLAIYLGLLIFASFFQYGKSYLLQVAANRIIQNIRLDVFQHIQKVPIQYFDNLPAGKVVSRITNDTEAIRELYMKVLAVLFTSVIYMTGVFVALFLLDPTLASITLLVVPFLIVWFILYRKFASRYNHIIRSRLSDINGKINESIQGMRIIQVFRRKKATNDEFTAMNDEHFKYQNKLLSLNALTSHNLVHTLRNIAFVVMIWYFGGASLGVGAVISVGLLYAFVDYLNRLFNPVTDVVNQLAVLQQAQVAAERVFELLDEPGEEVAEGEIERYQGDVSFKNVWFAYKEDEYVLKNISFEAKQGETIALVGHTGSGKSSIMNLLFRFYDPNKGSIVIHNQDIKNMPKQHLRSHMGIVLQDPFLFTGSIASNVSLHDPRISREQVMKALKEVGADSFIESLPQGYDEPVIEKGSTLSAGQRQLISFARALAFNPAILILDEATANIDSETEALIQDALEVLKKGRTTFIIAHRLSTIVNADQIIVLERGEILERGTHLDLLKLRGKYYQMYQMQLGQTGKELELTEQVSM